MLARPTLSLSHVPKHYTWKETLHVFFIQISWIFIIFILIETPYLLNFYLLLLFVILADS